MFNGFSMGIQLYKYFTYLAHLQSCIQFGLQILFYLIVNSVVCKICTTKAIFCMEEFEVLHN